MCLAMATTLAPQFVHFHKTSLPSPCSFFSACSYSVASSDSRNRPYSVLANAQDAKNNNLQLIESQKISPPSPSVFIEQAKFDALLQAAACLRTRSFYNYPEDRSPEAKEMHRNFMASMEFKTLQSKIAGTEAGYKRVACLVALCPVSDEIAVGDDLKDLRKVVTVSKGELLVIGTLDLNQGQQLPGEIIGSRPLEPDGDDKRAYISNFCVAKEARRKGIGTLLVKYAQQTAKAWGVNDLYVHVVAENDSAFNLYKKAGFELEREESICEARLLARPRRLLLWMDLAT